MPLTFPAIDPVAIHLGPVAIRWYGLAYFVGILLGWRYLRGLVANQRLWGGRPAPMTLIEVDDLLLWMTLGVVIGGRLGNVLFYDPAAYMVDPLAIFRIWEGGMAFHGGLIGVIVAICVFAWRRNIPALSILDLAAATTPIGLFFGRVANFVNGELWGRVTDEPWGIVFCNPTIRAQYGGVCPAGDLPRHPSQLYEAAMEGVVLFLILRVLTHRALGLRRPGLTGGAFIGLYGLFRIAMEFLREPDPYTERLGSWLTMGIALSVPMVIIGLSAVLWALRRRPIPG